MNIVSDDFKRMAKNSVRPLDWQVSISWSKDKIETEEPVQPWDEYDYQDFKGRVVDLNVERSVEFPNNIQSAVADVALNNYDGYFTFGNSESPISGQILPSRPIRIRLGFAEVGTTPVFVGLTEQIPNYSGQYDEHAQITALDFLSQIAETDLSRMVMMRDVRTDEVISEILQQFGMAPEMYSLAHGINTIPFVYFASGKNAGNALKELIQAENGYMWIDENGIIRFENRNSKAITWAGEINDTDIIEITGGGISDIYNKVTVSADVRKVQAFQSILSADNSSGYQSSADDDPYRVRANSTTTFWLNFDDPIWTADLDITLNGGPTDGSVFSCVSLSGARVPGGVTAVGTLFADTMKVDVTNTNSQPVSIDFIEIWGEPARVIGSSPSVKVSAFDEESVAAFGVRELKITDNTCFGSAANVESYVDNVLALNAGFRNKATFRIKGSPAMQLWDGISVNTANYSGLWRITAIKQKLADSALTTEITAQIISKTSNVFILDVSKLNGPDLIM